MKQNLQKAESRLSEEKGRRDTINKKYTELVEKQRLYFKAVKEFQEVRSLDRCYDRIGV